MLHVCNYNGYFKTYEEPSIELEVLVGIHSKAKVHEVHCWSEIEFWQEVLLINIFHIPDIKKIQFVI